MIILGMVAIHGAIWRILTILGMVTFLGMVTILRMVTIIGGGGHPRDSGCLRDFYHPKGWLLSFGSVES